MKTNKTSSLLKLSAALLLTGVIISPLQAFATQAAADYMTATRYDEMGRVTGVIQPNVNGFPAVRNTYDVRGLLIKVENGMLTSFQSEDVSPKNWPGFTLKDQQVFTYDDQGRKATEAHVSANGQTKVGLIQYSYDELGQIMCKTVRMNPSLYTSYESNTSNACALGTIGAYGPDRITRYTYNANGQVTLQQRAYGTNLVENYVTNEYDATYNRLAKQTDANGNPTELEYGPYGKLSRMYFSFSDPRMMGYVNHNDYEEYTYDRNGNRKTLRKRDGRTITYSYDNLNRVVTKDIPPDTTNDVYYDYELFGAQKSAHFASGKGTDNIFDGFGELISESTNVNGTAYALQYAYDRDGNRITITHPDSVNFAYAYDGLDRLKNIYQDSTAGPMLMQYAYDNLARLYSATTLGAATTTVGYDGVSQIQTVSLNPVDTMYAVTNTFGYNPAAQITSQDINNDIFEYREKGSKTGAYTVNGLNQYMTVGAKTFQYDLNANLTSDGDTIFGYDIENRLISATGARNAALNYDPQGRLYQVSSGSRSTYFLYSGDQLVAEYQNGVMTKRYVFSGSGDKPVVQYADGTPTDTARQFVHANYQGSVVAATDNAGKIIYVNTYDAFGVPAASNQGRFAYTGQTYVPEIGMYYYKARIYYPQIGRFLQTDPIGYKDDMDLYTYVGNDPMDKTDPTGTSILEIGFLVQDVVELGSAISSGEGVGVALAMTAIDVVGVAAPVPGISEAAHAVKAAHAIEVGVKAEKVAKETVQSTRELRGGEFATSKAESIKKAGGVCEYCGKNAATQGDHAKTLNTYKNEVNEGKMTKAEAKAEANGPGNIVASCSTCNQVDKNIKDLGTGPGQYMPSAPSKRIKDLFGL